MGRRSLLKPQHRVVLGLIAMSAGALLMTLLNPAPPPEDAAAAPPPARQVRAATPGTTAGTRAPVPVPAAPAPPAAPASLEARIQRLGPALAGCSADPEGFAPADGRLELVIGLGPGGLVGAHVPGLAALGDGAGACLGAALGEAGWPAAEPGTAVRVPFFVVQPVGRTVTSGPAPLTP